MENQGAQDIRDEITDEDVLAALKESKLDLNLSAEALRKIYDAACRHARSRTASRTVVRDVMTRDVLAVSKFDEVDRAVKTLSEKNVSGLPVVDRENRVVGVISEADIVSRVAAVGPRKKGGGFRPRDVWTFLFGEPVPDRKMGHIVGDVMTSPAVTIQPGAEISEAVRLMDRYRIRRLAVVDSKQRLIGLISRSDIVRTMGEKLGGVR
ncbi:MAG: CBS domain-containing protein [Candidatus Sulfobium sp.]|jgi:CBS domain-containing protein